MGFEVVIFVIYLDVKDRERNKKIVEDLERNLEKHENENIIPMGDFNGHLLLLLLLLKKVSSARLGESDVHPISPKTPAPQYQPIDRNKRKGKRVEDYSRDRAA